MNLPILDKKCMDLKIALLRENYTKDGLPDESVPDQPMDLFKMWFDEALGSKVTEPNAMTLSTVDKHGKPDARMVLMKGMGEDSIRFFTNYDSTKAKELNNNPHAACVFWWPELERQVRVRGHVQKTSRQESEVYFSTRPLESQIGAWASGQSQPVGSRKELEQAFNEARRHFSGKPIPTPSNWGGYELSITEIEFWQGRPGRMHDRIIFRKKLHTWNRERLSP